MLNRSITTTLAALAIAGASVTAAYASEEALLDALVKKGVLKQADAQKIKAESAHAGSGGNSKIKLNESVKEMALYGDLRLRWQHAQGQAQADTNPVGGATVAANNYQDQSARFRLAIGANVKLTDGVFAGVELITGSSPTDRFRTLGAADGGANNGAQDYSLNIGKAFVGWHATPEITLIAGRQGVPFYSTEMVWDNDVRLDGVSENINLGKLLGFGEGFGLHFIAGQFITGNNQSYDSSIPRAQNTDAWIYQAQLKAVADLGGAKLTVAPGVLWANGANSSNNPTKGTLGLAGLSANNFATDDVANNVAAILVPGDVSFDLAGTKAKFLWDFAYNFATTASRLNAATSATEDRMAWLAGFQLGQNHHKGDFSVFANWREVGAGAVNQGFSDSDFGLGFLNQRGYQVGTSYSLTSATKLSVTYSATNNIDQDATTTTVNSTHLATVQLGVKF